MACVPGGRVVAVEPARFVWEAPRSPGNVVGGGAKRVAPADSCGELGIGVLLTVVGEESVCHGKSGQFAKGRDSKRRSP